MIYLLSPTAKKNTIHLPMISFSLTQSNINFGCSDTLMFTSKQAVKSAEILNPKWKKYPCLAIGASTAKMIQSLGGEVIYQPKSFYGESLSKDIIKFFKNKNILYLRPQKVSFDSKAFLYKEGFELHEQIIYKTSCIEYSKDHKPPKNSIIIFTSPSTIFCFLKNFNWESSYTAIVIGEATKIHLPKDSKYKVANRPLIDSCIEKAMDSKFEKG